MAGDPIAGSRGIWPGQQWAAAKPGDVEMDEAVLGQARDFALAHEGSGCVVRHGHLVMTWGDPSERIHVYSATKGIGATLLGLAIDEGKMRLADRAADHHPTFGVPPESNRRTGWLDDITVLHLATHTAGFGKDKGYTPVHFRPGSMFLYSDGGTNWLSECLTLAYRQDVHALLAERVLVHLGITEADLRWASGESRPETIEGLTRLPMNARIWASADALARIGYLYLRSGVWDGRQIVSRDFIEQLRRPVQSLAGVPTHPSNAFGGGAQNHGLLWWNNADGHMAEVPRDAYWTHGLNSNLIIVVPSLDLVVSRVAPAHADWQPNPFRFANEDIEPFLTPVVASVRQTKGAVAVPDARPPARSPMIARLTIEPERLSIGDGDNWPITWADDDDLYTVYCDGRGWGDRRFSMAMAKVAGRPPNVTGANIPSPTGERGPDDTGYDIRGRKACGLVAADGVLWMWVRNLNPADGTGSSLAWSTDCARTWQWASWSLPECGYPVWLNAGRDYADALDEHLYFYWPNSASAYAVTDTITMGRVPRSQADQRDAYTFLVGTDASGRPTWSRRFEDRHAVLTYGAGCYRPCVVYNSPLKRYLLCTITTQGRFGLFDAPQPWGPWKAVHLADRFGLPERRFAPQIPGKWISRNGLSFYLVYSCHPVGPYQFNFQRCTLGLP